jgi:hypothetical protein
MKKWKIKEYAKEKQGIKKKAGKPYLCIYISAFCA